MLTIYRRHKKSCEHRSEGREYRRCRCPLWVDGFLGGKGVRQSLAMDDWEKAHRTVQGWEAARKRTVAEVADAITIEGAEKEFLARCEAEKLKKSSIDRYRILFRELDRFAASEGFRFLKQIDALALNRFRAAWKGRNGQASSGLTDLKKIERLRSFFRFALDHGHIQQNPAAAIRNPKIHPNPTLPFSGGDASHPRSDREENHGCEAVRKKQSAPSACADPATALLGAADLRRHRMFRRSSARRQTVSLYGENRPARLRATSGVCRRGARTHASRE
jgi:hypothetical protein